MDLSLTVKSFYPRVSVPNLRYPEVEGKRMGLIGHGRGALPAIMAAGKVDSPKALIALSCPPPITDQTYPGLHDDFGRWGRKHSHVIEVPNQGTLPWLSGISAA